MKERSTPAAFSGSATDAPPFDAELPMAEGKRDVYDADPPVVGDMADEAAKQMPGKPPNLAFDPSKRTAALVRAAGDRAMAEAAKKPRRKKKK